MESYFGSQPAIWIYGGGYITAGLQGVCVCVHMRVHVCVCARALVHACNPYFLTKGIPFQPREGNCGVKDSQGNQITAWVMR